MPKSQAKTRLEEAVRAIRDIPHTAPTEMWRRHKEFCEAVEVHGPSLVSFFTPSVREAVSLELSLRMAEVLLGDTSGVLLRLSKTT
jgi:hypothetical protein